MPPLSRDRLVLSGAVLLVGALLLTLLLAAVDAPAPDRTRLVLQWLTGAAQLVGAVLLGGGLVLREQARRALRPRQVREPQLDWYGA